MRPNRSLVAISTFLIVFAVSLSLLVAGASAQLRPAMRGTLPAIDSKVQKAVIDSITATLDEAYVFADKAVRMDSLLHANLAAGAYRALTDPVEFTQRLQTDVASVYLDRHMQILALPPGSISSKKPGDDFFKSDAARERFRRNNYEFKKAEILAGNVGYLKLDMFVETDLAGATAAAAMGFLSNVDALIIDLRDNPGGSASMIQLLTGYLFKDSAHLIDWYDRKRGETTQSWSTAWVPGKPLFDVPVYVLVSSHTGSAAEEFTFDLKNQKRATVVGERTGGAAHTVEFHTFDVGAFIAGLQLPRGRALDPVTKTNWEAVGVEPDIAVPADKALSAAHLDALKKLEENAKDDAAKSVLAWARDGLESQGEPYTLPAKALGEYTGTFGPRKVFIEGAKLMYQRQGGPKLALVPMRKDLFGVEGTDFYRVRFTRGASGAIDGLVGMYDDGHQEPNPKSK